MKKDNTKKDNIRWINLPNIDRKLHKMVTNRVIAWPVYFYNQNPLLNFVEPVDPVEPVEPVGMHISQVRYLFMALCESRLQMAYYIIYVCWETTKHRTRSWKM